MSKHVRFEAHLGARPRHARPIQPGNFWAEGDEWIVAQRGNKAVAAFRPINQNAVKRYIAGKLDINITDVHMFDPLSPKTLGRIYVAVRRECRDRDRDHEARMKLRLLDEEDAKRRYARKVKANMCFEDRAAFEREELAYRREQVKVLGRYVEQVLGINRKQVAGSQIEKLVVAAVEKRAYDWYGGGHHGPRGRWGR